MDYLETSYWSVDESVKSVWLKRGEILCKYVHKYAIATQSMLCVFFRDLVFLAHKFSREWSSDERLRVTEIVWKMPKLPSFHAHWTPCRQRQKWEKIRACLVLFFGCIENAFWRMYVQYIITMPPCTFWLARIDWCVRYFPASSQIFF